MQSSEQDSSWLTRPLCMRYALATFAVTTVRIRSADGVHKLPVHWGIGWLSDGECEILGAWHGGFATDKAPADILDDLRDRGVERIWHAIGSSIEPLQARLAAIFPGAIFDHLADPVFTKALAAAQGRVHQPAELLVEQIRNGLTRVIHRHGVFVSPLAALNVVACTLQQADRHLGLGSDMRKVRYRLFRRQPADCAPA